MEILADISEPQARKTHLEQKYPYIQFCICLFSFKGRNCQCVKI